MSKPVVFYLRPSACRLPAPLGASGAWQRGAPKRSGAARLLWGSTLPRRLRGHPKGPEPVFIPKEKVQQLSLNPLSFHSEVTETLAM